MQRPTAYQSNSAKVAAIESYNEVLARWPVPYESRFVKTSVGAAHVLISGPSSGPSLVLLHGGGGNATMWVHNIRLLAESLRVFALDIVGDVGKSEGDRPLTELQYVNWLEEVLIGLGLQNFHLCGASFGAWLSCAYQRHAPTRILTLALLAPPHLASVRLSFLTRAIFTTLLPTESRVRRFYSLISSPQAPVPPAWAMNDFLVRWRCQRQSPPPPKQMTDAEMRALPSNTLLLLGQDEVLYSVEKAKSRLRLNAPHISSEVLEAAGHSISIDLADQVGERLRRFILSPDARHCFDA